MPSLGEWDKYLKLKQPTINMLNYVYSRSKEVNICPKLNRILLPYKEVAPRNIQAIIVSDEPYFSVGKDMCLECDGKGCKFCNNNGYLEYNMANGRAFGTSSKKITKALSSLFKQLDSHNVKYNKKNRSTNIRWRFTRNECCYTISCSNMCFSQYRMCRDL